jgi:hypothetical protein
MELNREVPYEYNGGYYMEFLTKLVETAESKEIRDSSIYRSFQHIKNNGVNLSVQASYAHYCEPRLTLDNLGAYTQMEFALMKNNEFISVADILPKFENLAEIQECFDGSVYSFVPVRLIEQLYQEFFREKYPWEK